MRLRPAISLAASASLALGGGAPAVAQASPASAAVSIKVGQADAFSHIAFEGAQPRAASAPPGPPAAAEAFRQARAAAGVDASTPATVLCDGDAGLWQLQRKVLPGAAVVLDCWGGRRLLRAFSCRNVVVGKRHSRGAVHGRDRDDWARPGQARVSGPWHRHARQGARPSSTAPCRGARVLRQTQPVPGRHRAEWCSASG